MKQKQNDPNLDRIDWNAWRAKFDTLSYTDQQAAYAEAEKYYPDQRHFPLELIIAIVKYCEDRPNQTFRVLELGGWKGELADTVLKQCPNITFWNNVELLESCRTDPNCVDDRYNVEVLEDYIWNSPPKWDMISSLRLMSLSI